MRSIKRRLVSPTFFRSAPSRLEYRGISWWAANSFVRCFWMEFQRKSAVSTITWRANSSMNVDSSMPDMIRQCRTLDEFVAILDSGSVEEFIPHLLILVSQFNKVNISSERHDRDIIDTTKMHDLCLQWINMQKQTFDEGIFVKVLYELALSTPKGDTAASKSIYNTHLIDAVTEVILVNEGKLSIANMLALYGSFALMYSNSSGKWRNNNIDQVSTIQSPICVALQHNIVKINSNVIHHHLNHMNPEDIITLLAKLVYFEKLDDNRLLWDVSEILARKFSDIPTIAVGNCLSCLRWNSIYNPKLCDLVADHCHNEIKFLPGHTIRLIVLDLVKLGHYHHRLYNAAFEHIISTCDNMYMPSDAMKVFPRLVDKVTISREKREAVFRQVSYMILNRIDSLPFDDIAQVILSMHRHGYKNSELFHSVFEKLNSISLKETIASIGLNEMDAALLRKVLSDSEGTVTQPAPTLSSSHCVGKRVSSSGRQSIDTISNVHDALSYYNRNGRGKLSTYEAIQLVEKIGNLMKDQMLDETTYPEVIAMVAEVASRTNVTKAFQLVRISYSVSLANINDIKLFEILDKKLRQQVDIMNPHELGITAWSFAKAKRSNPVLFRMIGKAYISHLQKKNSDGLGARYFSLIGYFNIVWAFSEAGIKAPLLFQLIRERLHTLKKAEGGGGEDALWDQLNKALQ